MKDYSTLDSAINEVLDDNQPNDNSSLDSAINEVLGQDNLKPNLYASTLISPIEATSQYRLSKQSNVPVEVLKTHANEVKQMTEFNSFDVEDLKNNFPKVALQLQDIAKAPAIRDDIKNLSYFERWTKDIAQSSYLGIETVATSVLKVKKLLGQELSPSEQNRLDLEGQFDRKDYKIGYIAGIPAALAETVPLMGASLATGGVAALGVAATGVASLPAAIGMGYLADMGLREAGSSYDELSKIKDSQGKEIEQDVKVGASVAVGAATAAIEAVGLKVIGKATGIDKLISNLSKESIKRKVQSKIGIETFKKIGKGMAASSIAEGSTEALQEFTNITFTELAKLASSGDFKAFETEEGVVDFFSKAWDQVGQSFKTGSQVGLVFGGAGSAISQASERAQSKKQGEFEQSKISDALKSTKESKIFKRDPELFVDATDNTLGEQNIYIPADKAQEFFQSEEDYNKFIATVPEAAEQLQEALDVGGNLVLPANKVLSAMAQNPSFEALQEWMRLTPESINASEFEDSYFNDIAPQAQQEGIKKENFTKSEAIQRDLESQLNNSGYTPDTSRLYSTALRSFYDTQLERLGDSTKAKEIVDKAFANLKISNEAGKENIRQTISKIDDLDLFIDKAKRPQKAVKVGKPLIKMLKDKGGVKIGSTLAGELGAMGINMKTSPALFRKNGGLGDIDNIPFSEFQDQFPNANLNAEGDYVNRQDLLDAIGEEIAGKDISQVVDEQGAMIDDFIQELDRAGVDIKTATNQEIKDAINGLQTYNQDQSAPTFYSQLEKQITDLPQGKGSPEQWAGIIKNLTQKGVKQEELDWTGIEDWIKEQKGSVTKEQILEYLAANKIEVEEVVKGAYTPELNKLYKELEESNDNNPFEYWREEDQDQWMEARGEPETTKFSKYTLAGGENYRELLLTLPTQRQDQTFDKFLADYRARFPKSDSTDVEVKSFYDKGVLVPEAGKMTSEMSKDIYKSSHYDEVNILAHIRFNERTDADGSRVMFVEEIQSDWHQEGRKKGYKDKDPSIDGWKAEKQPSGRWSVYDEKGQWMSNYSAETEQEAIAAAADNRPDSRVPNAPFKTTWDQLAFKRALMWAVENKFDKVAWTTGEQQAERYDLSKQVEEINWAKNTDGTFDATAQLIAGGSHKLSHINIGEVENNLGKDIAKTISESDKEGGIISGDGLKVGGEGMKAFYDKMLPSMVNKLAKKFGGKVEETEIDAGKVWSLEITPAMRKTIQEQGLPLFQGGEKPKGSIQFNAPSGETIISLFEGKDLSTLLHESGHFFLETQRQISELPDAPEQFKKDWQATLDWLGSKDGNLTRDQHEQFARGFEAYLYEGKAPSIELRDAFRRFKAWLVRIYKDIKNLNVKVSKEMAEVFDRMLATDEQIEALKNNPLFKIDPKVAEMLTAAEKADYIARSEKANEKAKELLMKKTLKQREREDKKWWKEEKEKIKAETTERFNKSPLYGAVHFLKTGKLLDGETPADLEAFKMDRQGIKDRFSPEMIKYLPDGISGKNGVAPELIAEMFGFSSADEMLKSIMNLPDMKVEINKAVDEEMFRRYGDMLNDGSLEREAIEDMQNQDRGSQISFELETINRKTGNFTATKEQFKIKAREILGAKNVNEAIKPSSYYLAEIRATREAGKALGKKDYELAAEWKRKQLLNHYLFSESTLAKKNTEKALKKFAGYSEKQTKGKVKIDEDYRQKIVEILGNYNLAPKLSNAKADRLTAEALGAWMTEKETNDDAKFITPLELLNARDKTHYRDMTLDEFSSLSDLVENIAAQGRFLRTILIDGNREALADIGQNLSETIYKNVSEKKKTYETRGGWANTKFAVENFLLNVIKSRTLIREMDGFKDLGTAHNYLMKAIDSSELKKVERLQKVAKDMEAIHKKNYGNKSLTGKVFIPEINDSLTKEAIITIGLNQGNIDNKTKLMEGWDWSGGQVDAVLKNLDSKDWAYIQDVWNYLDSFWGEISALEKRRTGVVPERVSPNAFTIQTKDNKTVSLQGGYYPLKYDDRASSEVGGQALDELAKNMRSFSSAQTKRGHTKERVSNVDLPVRLDLAPLFQHLNAVVSDLTMGEALENTYKILHNRGVKKAISNTLGTNAFEQLDIWIKDLAIGGTMISSTAEKVLNNLRAGLTISTMGFKVSTILQQVSGFTQSFATLGTKYSILGIAKAFGNGNPMQINRNIAMIFEKSKFMKNRSTTFHRDIYDAMKVMQGKGQIKTSIAKAGFWGIVKAQMLVDMPTWLGAYQKGLKDFNSEEKAVEFADMVITQAQGSGMMKDLSGFERGSTSQTTRLSPMIKLFTVFYSYFNTKLNIAYEKYKGTDFKKPKDVVGLATDYALIFAMEGILSAALLGRLPDDEDEETTAAGIALWGAKLTVQNVAATIPFLSQISSGLQGFDSSPGGLRGFSAITQGVQTTRKIAEDIYNDEDVDIIKAVKVLNGTAGIIFQYPSSQLNTILGAMDKANKGNDVSPMDYLIYKK